VVLTSSSSSRNERRKGSSDDGRRTRIFIVFVTTSERINKNLHRIRYYERTNQRTVRVATGHHRNERNKRRTPTRIAVVPPWQPSMVSGLAGSTRSARTAHHQEATTATWRGQRNCLRTSVGPPRSTRKVCHYHTTASEWLCLQQQDLQNYMLNQVIGNRSAVARLALI
jgi:hypothetical protein